MLRFGRLVILGAEKLAGPPARRSGSGSQVTGRPTCRELRSGLGRSSPGLACEGRHLFAALSSECKERPLRRLIPGSFVSRGEEDCA